MAKRSPRSTVDSTSDGDDPTRPPRHPNDPEERLAELRRLVLLLTEEDRVELLDEVEAALLKINVGAHSVDP